MSNERLVKRAEVVALTGLSRSTIDRKIRENTFPRPLQISKRRVAWLEKDVLEWISAQQRVVPNSDGDRAPGDRVSERWLA